MFAMPASSLKRSLIDIDPQYRIGAGDIRGAVRAEQSVGFPVCTADRKPRTAYARGSAPHSCVDGSPAR